METAMTNLTPNGKDQMDGHAGHGTVMHGSRIAEPSGVPRSWGGKPWRRLWRIAVYRTVLKRILVCGVAGIVLACAADGVKFAVTGTPDPFVSGHSAATKPAGCSSGTRQHGSSACERTDTAQSSVPATTSHKHKEVQVVEGTGAPHAVTAPLPSSSAASLKGAQSQPPPLVAPSFPVQPPAPTGIPSPKYG